MPITEFTKSVEEQFLGVLAMAQEAVVDGVKTVAEAVELAASVAGLLDVRGLMAMGPAHGDPKAAFMETRRLRDEAQQRLGRELPILSMGMSADFEAAVASGSTMVRLGQLLFGPRPGDH